MGMVFTAAQLHAAIQRLLARQTEPDWGSYVVAYDPRKAPNPLTVCHVDYVASEEDVTVICTSGALKTLDHLGSLEALVARHLRRIPPAGDITYRMLLDAIDPDDVSAALEQPERLHEGQVLGGIYALLLPDTPQLRWQIARVVDNIRLAAICDGRFEVEVVSPYPWPTLSAATIDKLWCVASGARIMPHDQATIHVSGALAVAFAHRVWDVYGRILLAEAVMRRI